MNITFHVFTISIISLFKDIMDVFVGWKGWGTKKFYKGSTQSVEFGLSSILVA